MTAWLDAGSFFDQRQDRAELEEAARRADRLAVVKRRTEREFGPPPPDDPARTIRIPK